MSDRIPPRRQSPICTQIIAIAGFKPYLKPNDQLFNGVCWEQFSQVSQILKMQSKEKIKARIKSYQEPKL